MDAVRAILALGFAAGVLAPGIALSYRIWTRDDFAAIFLVGVLVLVGLALVFMVKKQEERVLHLKREDQLDRALLSRAAHIQLSSAALVSGQNGHGSGGGSEAELLAMLGRGRGDVHSDGEAVDG